MLSYPPTDSLYKFSAIAGLIVIGCSLYFPMKLSVELELETNEVSTSIAIAKAKNEHLSTKIAEVNEIIKNSILVHQGGYIKDLDKLQLNYSPDEVKLKLGELKEMLLETKIIAATTVGLYERSKILYSQTKELITLAIVTFGTGLCLTVLGFLFWYIKIQVPLDHQIALNNPEIDNGLH